MIIYTWTDNQRPVGNRLTQAGSDTEVLWLLCLQYKIKIKVMKELYDYVEITMDSISLEKFNVKYEDLSDEQVKLVHKIYFAQ